MIYDDLDFMLLKFLLDKKNTTTYKMAKELFKNEMPRDYRECDLFMNRKCALIISRIKKMLEENLIICTKNGDGKNCYILIKDKVKLCKHKFSDGKIKNSIHILLENYDFYRRL